MSRLAKLPVQITPPATVTFVDGVLSVKGPKGTLTRPVNRFVSVEVSPNGVQLSPKGVSIASRASVGTYASHLRNMLEGVTKGFSKKLLIEGVGFKWEVTGKSIKMGLGFSHPVVVAIPEGLTVVAEKGALTVSGFDKDLVGQFTANIRALKKPEPYKGKGFRYNTEVIRRKQGKKSA